MKFSAARWIMWALILLCALSACAGATPALPSSIEPTRPPEPTVTLASVSTPALVAPGEIKGPRFTPYEDNPVLTVGKPGSWDSGVVFNARVVSQNGLYHMFYNGADLDTGTLAIGYAKSSDGRNYTKDVSNPILEGDERGFDAIQVSDGVPIVESGTWILYYNAGAGPGPGRAIGRATAPHPTGPWSRRMEPVLRSGEHGAWDSAFITPQSIVRADGGYVMYYVGGTGQVSGPAMVGKATSTDGVIWTKHDDPNTREPPFAESDPVFQTNPTESWDSGSIWGCGVLQGRNGWEMFYAASRSGVVQIGYATSVDGVQWIRHEANPLLSPDDDPARTKPEVRILESPTSVVTGRTYLLYYDYGLPVGDIGLAIGTAR